MMLTATRVWLPLSIAVVGGVFTVIGHGKTNLAAVGVCLLLIAMTVWLINWLFRMSVESNQEREQEEEARRIFDRTGRWPDDEGSAGADSFKSSV
jgi:ABC-type transport system involved in cytochrome bd biosynthesis fused ATPase/permease subunit